MIILDSNVISEEIRPDRSAVVHAWLQSFALDELFTTTINEAEIRCGLGLLPDGERKQQLVQAGDRVLALFGPRILPFDRAAAYDYAAIIAERRRTGRPIGDFDALIAAIARSSKMAVATRDTGGFEGLGLSLINPWTA